MLASAIMATCAGFIAICLPMLVGLGGQVSGAGGLSPMAAMAGTFAWNFFSVYMPLDTLLSCVLTLFGYRMLVDSAAGVAAGVIKFLVG
jgi:hypothetical protein